MCEPAHLIFAKRGNTLTGTPSEMPFWPLKDGKEGLNSIWMLHIWTYNFTIMPILHEWVTWSLIQMGENSKRKQMNRRMKKEIKYED